MSLSSGSDITIPIQDSPPPPPSPYGNDKRGSKDDSSGKNRGNNSEPSPSTSSSPTGIENKGFTASPEKTENHKKSTSKDHTTVSMNGKKGKENETSLNEAVNSELVNMNILNTIPDKPQPQYGPYENFDEYFIPVNTHKKFLRRSEKLYLTKDKRKKGKCKKYFCWLLALSVVAAAVTCAVLVGVGLIPSKTSNSMLTDTVVATTTSNYGTTSESPSTASQGRSLSTEEYHGSSEETGSFGIPSTTVSTTVKTTTTTFTPPVIAPVDDTYVPNTADIQFTLLNETYEAALNDKSTDRFKELAFQVEESIKTIIKREAGLLNVSARVTEFSFGSVGVKMRVGWTDTTVEYKDIAKLLATVNTLGDQPTSRILTYEVVNTCRFGNNACSHTCMFDYKTVDFICLCPEPLVLDVNTQKICLQATSAKPDIDSRPASEIESSSSDHSHSSVSSPMTTTTTPATSEEPESSIDDNKESHKTSTTTETPHSSTKASSTLSETTEQTASSTQGTQTAVFTTEKSETSATIHSLPLTSTPGTTMQVSLGEKTETTMSPVETPTESPITPEEIEKVTISSPVTPETNSQITTEKVSDGTKFSTSSVITTTEQMTQNSSLFTEKPPAKEEMAQHHIPDSVSLETTTEESPLITTFITTRKDLEDEIAATTELESESVTTELPVEEKISESTITPLEILGMITSREGRTSKETELVPIMTTNTTKKVETVGTTTTTTQKSEETTTMANLGANETELVLLEEESEGTTFEPELLRTNDDIEIIVPVVANNNNKNVTTGRTTTYEDRTIGSTSAEFMVFSDHSSTPQRITEDPIVEHTTVHEISKQELEEESTTISLHNDTLVNDLSEVTPDTVNTEVIDDDNREEFVERGSDESDEGPKTSQRIEKEILNDFKPQPSNRDHRETTERVVVEQFYPSNLNESRVHRDDEVENNNNTDDLLTVESRTTGSATNNSPFISSDDNELRRK